jgi:hypothetical protein
MRLLTATGCLGGCLAILGLPLLVVTLIVSIVAALLGGVGLGLPRTGGLPGRRRANGRHRQHPQPLLRPVRRGPPGAHHRVDSPG